MAAVLARSGVQGLPCRKVASADQVGDLYRHRTIGLLTINVHLVAPWDRPDREHCINGAARSLINRSFVPLTRGEIPEDPAIKENDIILLQMRRLAVLTQPRAIGDGAVKLSCQEGQVAE